MTACADDSGGDATDATTSGAATTATGATPVTTASPSTSATTSAPESTPPPTSATPSSAAPAGAEAQVRLKLVVDGLAAPDRDGRPTRRGATAGSYVDQAGVVVEIGQDDAIRELVWSSPSPAVARLVRRAVGADVHRGAELRVEVPGGQRPRARRQLRLEPRHPAVVLPRRRTARPGCERGPNGEVLTPPVAEYGPEFGLIVSGARIYRGTEIPALAGKLVITEWGVSSIGTGTQGSLLVADATGEAPWQVGELPVGEDSPGAGDLFWASAPTEPASCTC
ncbi:MAG: hypothetical protein WKF58_02365 [Ilumatobacteraceae bacterium]